MTPDEFQLIINKIVPHTNYIYLHVLGEPLLHPQLDDILSIAEKANLKINITTNGSLLEKKKEILLNHSIRQYNISLHDAEENLKPSEWGNYIDSVLNFTALATPKSYVSLRLWNSTNADSLPFDEQCLSAIAKKYIIADKDFMLNKKNGVKLNEHIFLQSAPRFEWPNEDNETSTKPKTCYALKDHIAILSDGSVVPCCLDADANLLLGNIFEEELSSIIETEKAQKIKKGFAEHKTVEPFCNSCGFNIDKNE